MRAAKVQASLRIRAVSPEPPLIAHTSSESRGTFRQKARSLAPLNGWACAVKICHDGMLEDTNSLDWAQVMLTIQRRNQKYTIKLLLFYQDSLHPAVNRAKTEKQDEVGYSTFDHSPFSSMHQVKHVSLCTAFSNHLQAFFSSDAQIFSISAFQQSRQI